VSGNIIWRWIYHIVAVIAEAVRLSWHALRKSTRVVAVPFLSFLVAAYALVLFARNDREYLAAGTGAALGSMFAFAATGVAALTIAWIALARQSLGISLRSAALTLSNFGARLLVVTAVGGWAIGLLGTFGPGPIRVGWVTIGATVLLVLSALWSAARNRARGGRPDGPPAGPRERVRAGV
jgi:hypothetical protein